MVHAARVQPEMGFVADSVFPMNPSFQPAFLPVDFYSFDALSAGFRNQPRN
jgi:hypothetical protein